MEKLTRLLPVTLVVLFGSYARGNYTVASDIDLLVTYEGKPRQDAYSIVKKSLEIPLLEPHVYSETEYHQHKKAIQRMINEGKVIYQKSGAKK